MPRSSSGRRPTCSSSRRWPGLRRAVADLAVGDAPRRDRLQDGRRHGGGEAVEHHRHAAQPCGQDRTQHRRQLAPADVPQHLQRVGHRGAMPVQRLARSPPPCAPRRRRRGRCPARPSSRRLRRPGPRRWRRRAWCWRCPSRRSPADRRPRGRPRARHRSPAAQPASLIAGRWVKSCAGRPWPTGTTRSSAPASPASWLIAAPPAAKFATIWSVTSAG